MPATAVTKSRNPAPKSRLSWPLATARSGLTTDWISSRAGMDAAKVSR